MKSMPLVGILISVLAVTMLAGCGRKEVDYTLDGDTEIGAESPEESAGINDDSLAQFRNMENWVDEWSVVDKYGATNHHIDVDAEIVVPGLESMRVIESTPLGGDDMFNRQCLESFFGGDTEYYYHEPEQYTREELEKWLPDETGLIAHASDSRMVAEEFESVAHYAAYRDEILHEIYITDTMVTIQPNWEEVSKCGPEQFRGYKQVDVGGNPIEGEENECKYSLEEAERIADDYMKEIGLSAMERTETTPIVWRGNNMDSSDEGEMEQVCYGYWFEYATGIDGISFEEFPRPTQYRTSYCSEGLPYGVIHITGPTPLENQGADSVGGGSARILVTDVGLYSVTIENPEVIRATSNSVGLLPLNTIKEILEKEVIERTAKYDILDYRVYNHLQLIYLKVSDDTKETVSAVPVWCFAWKATGDVAYYKHPVFVNAIDGSIVHFADIEWSGEELPED